ncbi:signal peptidase II [Nitriliruptoraceae bacterium ZYF776]|nr:signal peptidase II [Profundirhabdus halotolerans]
MRQAHRVRPPRGAAASGALHGLQAVGRGGTLSTSPDAPLPEVSGATPGDGVPASVLSRLPVQLALLLAAVGLVLDQATKVLAEGALTPGEFVPLLGERVGWQLVYNPGAAFGIAAPAPVFLVVTLIVVVIVARTLPRTHDLLAASAYGLLLSGALGNVIDRILRAEDGFMSGEVVDFVAWGSFPRFNVADSCITVGFVLLVIALWREERQEPS